MFRLYLYFYVVINLCAITNAKVLFLLQILQKVYIIYLKKAVGGWKKKDGRGRMEEEGWKRKDGRGRMEGRHGFLRRHKKNAGISQSLHSPILFSPKP